MSADEKVYENLTPQRKVLLEKVLANLENENNIWIKGWSNDIPISATTGKRYTGINNFALTIAAAENGYKDNRWATYSQILKNGWHFKKDENDQILAKGKGVGIEFFELRDKETDEKFSYDTVADLSEEEKREYIEKNVYPVKKYYHVFNVELIDGIKEREETKKTKEVVSKRADKFLTDWSKNESEIIYGGDDSFYNPNLDIIHLPEKMKFRDDIEFYLTALHEVSHSTGHETRMKRELTSSFGSEKYAFEELRAEISSMFLSQDFALGPSENNIKNNAAYIAVWKEKIKENPNALFSAIADAEKIASYVMAKEKDFEKGKTDKLYSIKEEGEKEKRSFVYHIDGNEITKMFAKSFKDKETAKREIAALSLKKEYENVDLKEVDFGTLEKEIIKREVSENIKSGCEKTYISPSEIASRMAAAEDRTKGEKKYRDNLKIISDIEVYEKSTKVKGKDKFETLFEGGSVVSDKEKNESMLFNRLAVFSKDKEQLIRIFKASGQYDKTKDDSYYDKMAQESVEFVEKIREKEKRKSRARKKTETKEKSEQKIK